MLAAQMQQRNYNESATTDDGSCAYQSLSVVINPDNFPGETSWSLVNDALEVVGSGLAEGADLCLAEACYTFTIFDSWGDGICCAFGNEKITFIDCSGTILRFWWLVRYRRVFKSCLQSSVVRTRWRVTILKRTTQKTVLAITHASVAWIQLQRTTTQQLPGKTKVRASTVKQVHMLRLLRCKIWAVTDGTALRTLWTHSTE